jgi:molybdenum cofactor cytidylyltransferase
LEVTLAINECWWEGIGTSIRVGLAALQAEAPATSATVLLVCDQPMVTATLIQDLLQAHAETGRSIAACRYGETLGVPALFGRYWFPILSRLPADAGAKRIIETHRDAVAVVEFPAGALDIDTPEDLSALQQLERRPEISQPTAAA